MIKRAHYQLAKILKQIRSEGGIFMSTCRTRIKEPDQYAVHLYNGLIGNILAKGLRHENALRIFVNLQGIRHFNIDGRRFSLKPGDVLFIGSGSSIQVYEESQGECYYIEAQPVFLLSYCTDQTNLMPWISREDTDSCHSIDLSGEEIKKLRGLMHRYLKSSFSYGNDIIHEICFIELMLLISGAYVRRQEDAAADPQYEEFIIPAAKYIDAHISSSITLTDLAEHIGISRSYLCRVFKQGTGLTVNQYIIERRISLAAELLLTGMNVTRVSEETGFNDYTYFIKVFKQTLGMTPKKYIRSRQQAAS